MSLKTKFKIDTNTANDGVWIEYKDCPNKDGSIPRFCVARANKQNMRYLLAAQKINKQIGLTSEGLPNTEELSEEESEQMELGMFLDAILRNWENFQPEDDGVDLQFSSENAQRIFGSRDWLDLYMDLLTKSQRASTFRTKQLESEAKN